MNAITAKFIPEVADVTSKEILKTLDTNSELLQFVSAYVQSLLRDMHDNLRLLYGAADFTRDCVYIHNRIKNEGIHFFTAILPKYMDDVLSMLEGRDVQFASFKTRKYCECTCPMFLNRLVRAVMDQRHSATLQARALHGIYCVCVSFKKLRGEPDEKLQLQQWADFCKVEDELASIDLKTSSLADLLASARLQFRQFASDITLDDPACVPRPGPGATVNVAKKSLRYAPQDWFTQIDKVFPMEEWFYAHPWDVVDKSRNYLDIKSRSKHNIPHSKFLCVPKTYIKWRGICKEYNEMQFLQQAVRRLLNKHIKIKLGNYLPLSDQSVHAKLALESSLTRTNATIDESEASDRILRELVLYIAQDTELHDVFEALSTKFVEAPPCVRKKVKIPTRKFAPMGSAICFPVMSLVHLFLIRAIILYRMVDITMQERKDLCEKVSVYGDDIVLPSSAVPFVYEWLPKFGMKINQSKSFVNSSFRESCGCHAYKGIDITPLYVKYTTSSLTDASFTKKMQSLFSLEYQAFCAGFHETAKFLRCQIQAKWSFTLPYVWNSSNVVGFKRPPSSPLLDRFNDRRWRRRREPVLQTSSVRVPVFEVKSERGIIPSCSEAYLRYWCLKPRNESTYTWQDTCINTPFRMDDAVHAVTEKSTEFKIRWTRKYVSELMPIVKTLDIRTN